MRFDYSKLLGRIREKGFTQGDVARHIQLSEGQLSKKLKGRYMFTQKEIFSVCDFLEIPMSDISVYFFTPRVENITTIK